METNLDTKAPPLDQRLSLFARARSRARGPGARPSFKKPRNYLLKKKYRKTNLLELLSYDETQLSQYLEKVRWGGLGVGLQACPKCGVIDQNYRCPSINGWKCKTCKKQFSVLSGTRLHGMKMTLRTFVSVAFHFVEAKDGISSRELSGLHGLDHQTCHVLTLKIREALRETLGGEEPLTGYVQADAAYFIKYVRPSNIGTGAALAAKAVQKNAGLDAKGHVSRTVSESMHALVVFVQSGPQGTRRYRIAMIKTETAIDLLTLGQRFCANMARIATSPASSPSISRSTTVESSRPRMASTPTSPRVCSHAFERPSMAHGTG
jgi:transposase-like protein